MPNQEKGNQVKFNKTVWMLAMVAGVMLYGLVHAAAWAAVGILLWAGAS
jgi:hypothetical protein